MVNLTHTPLSLFFRLFLQICHFILSLCIVGRPATLPYHLIATSASSYQTLVNTINIIKQSTTVP